MIDLKNASVGVKIVAFFVAIGLFILYTVFGYFLYSKIAVAIFNLPQLSVLQYYGLSWLLHITLNPAKFKISFTKNKEE